MESPKKERTVIEDHCLPPLVSPDYAKHEEAQARQDEVRSCSVLNIKTLSWLFQLLDIPPDTLFRIPIFNRQQASQESLLRLDTLGEVCVVLQMTPDNIIKFIPSSNVRDLPPRLGLEAVKSTQDSTLYDGLMSSMTLLLSRRVTETVIAMSKLHKERDQQSILDDTIAELATLSNEAMDAIEVQQSPSQS